MALSDQLFRLPATDHAAFEFVAVRSGPVRFKVDVSRCSHPLPARRTALPVDVAFAERAPDRLVASECSPSRGHVRCAWYQAPGNPGNGFFARNKGIRRIPDNLQVFLIHSGENRAVSCAVAILQACSFSMPMIRSCSAARSESSCRASTHARKRRADSTTRQYENTRTIFAPDRLAISNARCASRG